MAHRKHSGSSTEELGREVVKDRAFINVTAVFDPAALGAAGNRVWRL
jgi:hypothetical protein